MQKYSDIFVGVTNQKQLMLLTKINQQQNKINQKQIKTKKRKLGIKKYKHVFLH